uniref:Endonuclease V n=1 Tax=Desulfobacca acetoxidans TaxID=60893 RepID=A0A7C3Z4Q7_9BACT
MLDYPRNYQEAVAWQEARRGEVRLEPLPRPPSLVGAADAAYDRKERRVYGAVVVMTYPGLLPVEEAALAGPCPFPYIPGLLSFREAPIIVEIWKKLAHRPQVLLVDGQGIAHPRSLGIAAHLGLLLDVPTIGVAKSRLVGEGEEPGREAGSATPLGLEGRTVGWILRTRTGVRPVYVSPGYRVSLADCREITLGCVKGYRLPEPLRRADRLSRQCRADLQVREGDG